MTRRAFEAVTLGPLDRQPLPDPPRLAWPMPPVADREPTYCLYFGASVTNPMAGMFSFFPCLSYSSAPEGFACPFIDLPGLAPDGGDVVKHGKSQGVKGQVLELFRTSEPCGMKLLPKSRRRACSSAFRRVCRRNRPHLAR